MNTWPTPAQLTAARRAGTTVTIGLPDGRHVLIPEYVRSWRILLTIPPDRSVANWSHFPTSAREILASISAGIHDRINRHIPGHGQGRKWDADWQRATLQAAHQLNHPRLRIHWLPEWLRARFAHRLATD
jgi:hypothetical protein